MPADVLHADDPARPYQPPQRIVCDEVQVGDYIARTRNAPFLRVVEVREGEKSRRLCFTAPKPGARRDWGENIRPRRDAKLWRLVEERCEHGIPTQRACACCGDGQ